MCREASGGVYEVWYNIIHVDDLLTDVSLSDHCVELTKLDHTNTTSSIIFSQTVNKRTDIKTRSDARGGGWK